MFIKAFGEEKAAIDWVKDDRCVVSSTILRSRINRGMDPEEAITTPYHKKRYRAWEGIF